MTDRYCTADCCKTPTVPMPAGDNSTACPACWNRLERLLAETPALVDELNTTITRQAHITLTSAGRRPAEPKEAHDGLGVHEQPLPFNLGASEALDLLHRTLWPWVREALQGTSEASDSVAPQLPDPSANGLSRFLLGRLTWLQGHPDGQAAVEEVTYAHAVAWHSVDRSPDRDYAGPCGAEVDGEVCPEDLYVAHDAHTATCRTCGTEWDVPERRAALLALAEDRLVTTTEACRAIKTYGSEGEHVTPDRIWKWKQRGRIMAHGSDARGRDLWRLGDILDLVRAG